MSLNPYEAPQTTFEPIAPSKAPFFTLYSPGHVAWATFLGAPLGGSILMALNYRRLGEPVAGATALAGGLIGSAGLVLVGFLLPENFPGIIIPVGSLVLMAYLAHWLQGERLEEHLRSGGEKASAWGATGFGLIGLLIVLGMIVGLVLVLPDSWFPE